eukprot:4986634-Amphidinium_carterae.1
MAYVDDLLVVGNPLTVKPFLEQFKVKLELKHVSQLTIDTPLEFLCKSIELQQDGTIHLSFSPQYYGKILKPHNMEKCNASTTPGSKKPLIKSTPLHKEQHSQYRMSQLNSAGHFNVQMKKIAEVHQGQNPLQGQAGAEGGTQ